MSTVNKNVLSVTSLLVKTLENATREYARECVRECASLYGFSSDEALLKLNLENLAIQVRDMKKRGSKKVVEKEKKAVEKKKKAVGFPLPFVASLVCEDGCHGLAYNMGLFTQCPKVRMNEGTYCKGCQSETDLKGKPANGTIEERRSSGLMEFQDSKGRRPVAYSKIMEKFKITREQVEAETGMKLDDMHYAVVVVEAKKKVEKKEKSSKDKKTKEIVVDDLFAGLEDVEEEVVVENEELALKKQQQEAELALKKQQQEAELALKKQQQEAELAKKAELKAAKEAELALKKQQQAEEAAKKAELKALKDAELAKKAEEKALKEAELAEKKAELKAIKDAELAKKAEEKAAKDAELKAIKDAELAKKAEEKAVKDAELALKKQQQADEKALKDAELAKKKQQQADELALKKQQQADELALKKQQQADEKAAKEADLAKKKQLQADAKKAEPKKQKEGTRAIVASEARFKVGDKVEYRNEKGEVSKGTVSEVKMGKSFVEYVLQMEDGSCMQSAPEGNIMAAKVEVAAEAAPKKVTVKRIVIGGKQYLKTMENLLYDPDTKEEMGIYDPVTNTIKELPDDSEDEVSEDGYDSE